MHGMNNGVFSQTSMPGSRLRETAVQKGGLSAALLVKDYRLVVESSFFNKFLTRDRFFFYFLNVLSWLLIYFIQINSSQLLCLLVWSAGVRLSPQIKATLLSEMLS